MTERTQSESERRYAEATRAGRVGVWDWSVEDGEIYVEPALKELIGYRDDEIANTLEAWGSHVHPDDIPMVDAAGRAALAGDTDLYEVTHRMIHTAGSIRWILARGSAVRDAAGRVIRIIGTDTDITDLVLAEEPYRSVAENVTDGLAIIEGDSETVSWASPSYDAIFRRPLGGSVGRVRSDVNETIHPDDRETVWSTVRGAINERADHIRYAFRALVGTGEYRMIENTVRFLYDETGSLSRAYVVARDVTEQAESDRRLREALDEKSQLMREMNHRVKNNLLSLSAILNMAVERSKSDEARDALAQSRDRVLAMVDIHDLLQQYGTSEAATFDLFVRRLVERYGAMVAGRAIRFSVDIQPVVLSLAHATSVGLLLNELIANAVKHAFVPDQTLEISISLSADEHRYTCVVSDNGPGLPADVDSKTTDSFGLVLVHAMVRQIDGTVEFSSAARAQSGLCVTVIWDH
jgi:PAS domain S-box-containing protein